MEKPLQSLTFKQVDVFTASPFKGNPVAVVLDGAGLSDAQMQRIANWTNLSETTFVLPATLPGADYRVRIFTPTAELPFAGHPTIGTAFALLEAGRIQPREGELVQECRVGLVRLRVEDSPEGGPPWISFELPKARITPLSASAVAELRCLLKGADLDAAAAPCLVDVGPRWVIARLRSAASVLALKPDLAGLKARDEREGDTGLTVFASQLPGAGSDLEVRSFVPAHGVAEDPVCGSGNGCVGAFIRHQGLVAELGGRLVSAQGAALGRAGRVRLSVSDEAVWVGGQAVTCVDGRLRA